MSRNIGQTQGYILESSFMSWNCPERSPLENPEEESARTSSYFHVLDAYMNENSDRMSQRKVTYGKPTGVSLEENPGYNWVQLQSAQDADYEAYHMRHSVGYSWGKYSQLGPIYSLRDENNRPLVTALAVNGSIVHAREASNMRLSETNKKRLADFAKQIHVRITPDSLPFEFYGSGMDFPMGNTSISYVLRSAEQEGKYHEGAVKLHSVVLKGSIRDNDIMSMVYSLPYGKILDVQKLGIPAIGNGLHEITSVWITDQAPTVDLTLAAFRQYMKTIGQPQVAESGDKYTLSR